MKVGVVKESFPDERRVALVPAGLSALGKAEMGVVVESGAGQAAGFSDAAYEEKGARVVADRGEVFASADVILQVRCLGANPEAGRADLELLRR